MAQDAILRHVFYHYCKAYLELGLVTASKEGNIITHPARIVPQVLVKQLVFSPTPVGQA